MEFLVFRHSEKRNLYFFDKSKKYYIKGEIVSYINGFPNIIIRAIKDEYNLKLFIPPLPYIPYEKPKYLMNGRTYCPISYFNSVD